MAQTGHTHKRDRPAPRGKPPKTTPAAAPVEQHPTPGNQVDHHDTLAGTGMEQEPTR